MQIFGFENMARFSHGDPLVNALICNLGKLFLSEEQILGRPSPVQVLSCSKGIRGLRQCFDRQLQSAKPARIDAMMICAALFVFLEVGDQRELSKVNSLTDSLGQYQR